MKQITALNRRLASLTIADMSPRLALQRILALYERYGVSIRHFWTLAFSKVALFLQIWLGAN